MLTLDDKVMEQKTVATEKLHKIVGDLIKLDKSTFTKSESLMINNVSRQLNNLVIERWEMLIKEAEGK